MNTTNKALLVIVVFLVVLFGVGQFFTSSNLPSPAATPSTNIVAYVPQAASSTPVEQGSCWTNSIAAPYRIDAWRCTVGNSISDPCFQIPGSNNLLCDMNPAEPDATSTFVLKVTQALPQAQVLSGKPPADWAWLVQLSDGTLCSPFTGTRPFTADGQAADYGCAPGPLGNDIYIFNDFNTSSSAWLADVGALSASTSSLPVITRSQEIPIATVWQ